MLCHIYRLNALIKSRKANTPPHLFFNSPFTMLQKGAISLVTSVSPVLSSRLQRLDSREMLRELKILIKIRKKKLLKPDKNSRFISRFDAKLFKQSASNDVFVNTLRTGLLNCLNARPRGLTFRHRASCIQGQAFRYSPENAFYIFNQQIYFII